jgi:hypothetical protein
VTVDASLVRSDLVVAEPGGRVLVEVGVEGCRSGDERPRLRVGTERCGAAAAAGLRSGGLVGASTDSPGPSLFDLIGEGVGQGGDGRGGADEVAVAVDEGVEVAQLGGAVTAQDGEAGRAKGATAELRSAGGCGRQGRTVEVGGPDSSAPRDRRIEVVAERSERVDDRVALVREAEERLVDPSETVDEGVALDLQLDARSRVDARGLPEEQAWSAPRSIGAVGWGHRGRPRRRVRWAEVAAAVATREPVEESASRQVQTSIAPRCDSAARRPARGSRRGAHGRPALLGPPCGAPTHWRRIDVESTPMGG